MSAPLSDDLNGIAPIPSEQVSLGSQVIVELVDRLGESERLTLEIVPDNAADFAHGFLGESTPLAKAILGKPCGSVVAYLVGDLKEARILAVFPGSAEASYEAAGERQAAMDKAIREITRTSASVFAASYTGKWGDYDPEGVEHWEE